MGCNSHCGGKLADLFRKQPKNSFDGGKTLVCLLATGKKFGKLLFVSSVFHHGDRKIFRGLEKHSHIQRSSAKRDGF